MDVGEKQKSISQMATADQSLKFHNLYDLIYHPSWLETAYQHVRRNAGSKTAGVDKVNMLMFEENLESNLQELREQLKSGTFDPLPVRRVILEEKKRDGRIKLRPLGIPAIRDRIVQEALRMILEPIWESDFSTYSYGFRPNRCTMDAVSYLWAKMIGHAGWAYKWVIEGDISSYFDTIHHRKLMKLVQRRIKEKKLLDLIWKFLQAGVLDGCNYTETLAGVPQGGIVSPLLANIYLHELDKYMEDTYVSRPQIVKHRNRKKGIPNFLYTRYADDFVVLCDGNKAQAQEMKEELSQFLKSSLKLELSREKTKITHVTDGFQFLGFWLERSMGTTGKIVGKIRIPESAIQKMRHKLHTVLSPSTNQESVSAKIMALNRMIGGWCRYYQYTSSPSYVFGIMENLIFWDMAHWIGRKYKLSIPKVLRKFRRSNTFAYKKSILIMPSAYKAKRYKQRTWKNLYLVNPKELRREVVPSLNDSGIYEARPGRADMRSEVLERKGTVCAVCGKEYLEFEVQIDHIKPYASFKRGEEANRMGNLQVLCTSCHRAKTKKDRRVLSRVR